MKILRGALRASHFGPTLLVTTISLIIALYFGFGWKSGLVAITILSGQLIVGWTNDIFDFKDDLKHNRLKKPLVSGEISSKNLRYLVFVTSPIVILISIYGPLGYIGGSIAILGVLVALSYNFYFKSTLLSPLPYVFCFGALPVAIAKGIDEQINLNGIFAGVFLGFSAHLINVLKDLNDDLQSGIRGFPQRIGERYSKILATIAFFIGIFFVLLFFIKRH